MALLNGLNVPIVHYRYTPYGEVHLTDTTSGATNPYQYTGRENDGTGFDYYRARYYSPGLKRFISEDPMGLNAGFNEYIYVKNYPMDSTDPMGLFDKYAWMGREIAGKYAWGFATGGYILFYSDNKYGTECSCNDDFGPGPHSLISFLTGGTTYTSGVWAAGAGGSAFMAGGIAVTSAAVGGLELGRGFNQSWSYFSNCNSSFGTWVFNATHDNSR